MLYKYLHTKSVFRNYYHNKKGSVHRTYKSLGSVETHQANGIADPIAHFQKEVDILNSERADVGVRKIPDDSPIKHLGYFPLKVIMKKLDIPKYVNYFHLTHDFKFDLFELLSTQIYARS